MHQDSKPKLCSSYKTGDLFLFSVTGTIENSFL